MEKVTQQQAAAHRNDKSQQSNPYVVSPDRIPDLTGFNFHPCHDNKQENAQVGNGLDISNRRDDIKQGRAKDDSCKNLANHCRLPEPFSNFTQDFCSQ